MACWVVAGISPLWTKVGHRTVVDQQWHLEKHGVAAAKADPVAWLEAHKERLLEVKRALAEEHGLTPPPKFVVVDLTQLLKKELKLAARASSK